MRRRKANYYSKLSVGSIGLVSEAMVARLSKLKMQYQSDNSSAREASL
jgi:hypothetical protein